MEPATYSITLEQPPADLLDRLRPVLAAQGSPTITARQDGDVYVFEGGWSELTLRCRAADALTTVWPAWQDTGRP